MRKIISVLLSLLMIICLSACVSENVYNTIEDLNKKIDEMQCQIDDLQKKSDEQNEIIKNMSKELADQKELISEQENKISNLLLVNNEQQSKIHGLQTTINSLQNQISKQDSLLNSQNETISMQSDSISSLKDVERKNTNDISNLKDENDELVDKMEVIESEKNISILIARYENARHSIISYMFAENTKARNLPDELTHGTSALSLSPMYTNNPSEINLCTTENVPFNSVEDIEKFEDALIAEITDTYNNGGFVTYYFSDLCSDNDGNCYAVLEKDKRGY